MKTVKPGTIPTAELHAYMLASIAPRPICFASTVDENGNPNLSPFSFFNAFGSNPPLLVFSPARRVRDNTIKHTLENVLATREVCINVVTYDMVQQVSLASTEYERGVNEFEKAGFTPLPSQLIKPFRVKESPVQIECKVNDIIETGTEGGAGNLVICEIVMMHIADTILDEKGKIDQLKLPLVARLGGDWYSKVTPESLFEVAKPLKNKGIGIDRLPEHIRHSTILTGNNLGQLGNVEKLPSPAEVDEIRKWEEIKEMKIRLAHDPENLQIQLHARAKMLLDEGNVADAWKILML